MAQHQLFPIAMLLSASALGGCASHLYPVASHTLRVSENQDADVVWITKDETLMRCSNAPGGPACVAVK